MTMMILADSYLEEWLADILVVLVVLDALERGLALLDTDPSPRHGPRHTEVMKVEFSAHVSRFNRPLLSNATHGPHSPRSHCVRACSDSARYQSYASLQPLTLCRLWVRCEPVLQLDNGDLLQPYAVRRAV